jgi:cytochrome P450
MSATTSLIPPGPREPYDPSQEIAGWLEAQRATYGDIYRASVYGSIIYVVSDPRYAQHVLRRNWQNYTKGPAIRRVELLLGRGLMTSEGELWKTQRRLIQPAFHDQVIAGLAPAIADANTALAEQWERAARDHASVNVTHDISLMVLRVVLVSIFGDDYPRIAARFGVLAEEPTRDLQFAQTFRPLRKLVGEIAARRRAEQRIAADFLGMLMDARDRDTGQGMSDAQLVVEIITLVVAGHETTAATLGWVWHLLAENPDAERKFHKELSGLDSDLPPKYAALERFVYTRQVIEEAMRLYPPGWLMTRRALNDDQLGDYFVPAGTEIYISPYIIQRHPDLWPAPDRFDPDRFAGPPSKARHPLATLPFSAGPRNCIGEALARCEMQMHAIMIGRRLRLRRADAAPLELEFGVNLRNRRDFIMVPELRAPAELGAVPVC